MDAEIQPVEQRDLSPKEKKVKFCGVLNVSRVKKLAHENGKRITKEAIAVLSVHIEERIRAACRTHDGGAKTISENLMALLLVRGG